MMFNLTDLGIIKFRGPDLETIKVSRYFAKRDLTTVSVAD